MNDEPEEEEKMTLETSLTTQLTEMYGPMIGGVTLWRTLGYTSSDAFRQAYSRGLVTVPVFKIENRRGKFALARDVARWLAAIRSSATPIKKERK
jgi:hypothetical protein